VLAHRKKLGRELFAGLPQHLRETALRLAVLLRLAARLCRSRTERATLDVNLEVNARTLTLTLPPGFLAEHPLTQADLAEESERLAAAGLVLIVS